MGRYQKDNGFFYVSSASAVGAGVFDAMNNDTQRRNLQNNMVPARNRRNGGNICLFLEEPALRLSHP